MRIDRYGRTLIPTYKSFGLSRNNLFHFDSETKNLWVGKNNLLTRYKLANSPVTKKVMMTAKNRFRGIGTTGKSVVVHTDRTVLRLDKNGAILQTIPAERQRKILKMHLANGLDSFLFSDGLLEVYNLETKSIEFHSLPISSSMKIQKFSNNGRIITLLENGKARLFKLSSASKN